MEIVFLITGLVIGFAAAWLVFHFKSKSEQGIPQEQFDELNNQVNSFRVEAGKSQERAKAFEENYKSVTLELNTEREKVIELSSKRSSLEEIN